MRRDPHAPYWVWALTAALFLFALLPVRSETPLDPGLSSMSADGGLSLPGREQVSEDPCALDGQTAGASRPTWTGGAATSECGQLQTDLGLLIQPLGKGSSEWMLPSNLRYGLTPRIELRWGLPTHVVQDGGPDERIVGVSDQSVGLQYWFHEQSPILPALALSYGIKIPSANPDKGFGTGYTDHQMVWIASRDIKRVHVDFNAAGVLAGGREGWNGALQMGLALSVPVSKRFTGVIDNFGGYQAGTHDRLGAVLIGGTWTVRPSLVVDGAMTWTYTGGQPRQQFTMGITEAARVGVLPIRRGSRLARILGRQ